MAKEIITKEGKLIFNRFQIAQEFFCERCESNKKAKNVIYLETLDGKKKTICNGCYGFLLSQSK